MGAQSQLATAPGNLPAASAIIVAAVDGGTNSCSANGTQNSAQCLGIARSDDISSYAASDGTDNQPGRAI